MRIAASHLRTWIHGLGVGGRRPRTTERQFLTWLAMLRRLMHPRVTYVGITGSCGKTTTTLLAGAILSQAGECRTSAHHRVVRNVLSVGSTTKYCVQEVPGSYPGRIRPQTRVLRPEIGIVTTIGSDHYKMFRSLEATAREKGKLIEDLPTHGAAILNVDDPHVRTMALRTRARVISYGLSPEAEVRGIEVSSYWPDRLSLTVTHHAQSVRVNTNLVGEHWVSSVLASIACGIACGVDLQTCANAVKEFAPVFGRYSVHPVPNGPVFVFDHKASIWTVQSGLDFIRNARAPRKTIIFGTISDYANNGGRAYRRIARNALEVADRVVFVGPQAGHVSRLCKGEFKDRLFNFQTTYEGGAFVREGVRAEDLILLKGSIPVDHLERIMLSQLETVVCWRERCGKRSGCPECDNYRQPHLPPFGLGRAPTTIEEDASDEEFNPGVQASHSA